MNFSKFMEGKKSYLSHFVQYIPAIVLFVNYLGGQTNPDEIMLMLDAGEVIIYVVLATCVFLWGLYSRLKAKLKK